MSTDTTSRQAYRACCRPCAKLHRQLLAGPSQRIALRDRWLPWARRHSSPKFDKLSRLSWAESREQQTNTTPSARQTRLVPARSQLAGSSNPRVRQRSPVRPIAPAKQRAQKHSHREIRREMLSQLCNGQGVAEASRTADSFFSLHRPATKSKLTPHLEG